MTDLPRDLVPLPTAPYAERPNELPLDVEECRTALWLSRGNIREAADRMKVSPKRLRRFVDASPRLSSEVMEAREQLKDLAESNVYDALTDDSDPGRRDSMSRFVLSQLGNDRGYGKAKGGVTINNGKGGNILISWADGSSVSGEPGDDAKVVNGDD